MLYLLMFLQIGAMFYALQLHRKRRLFANVIPAGIAVQIFGIGTAFVAVLKIVLLDKGQWISIRVGLEGLAAMR